MYNPTRQEQETFDAIVTAMLKETMTAMRSGYAPRDIKSNIMASFEQAGYKMVSLLTPYIG